MNTRTPGDREGLPYYWAEGRRVLECVPGLGVRESVEREVASHRTAIAAQDDAQRRNMLAGTP